MTPREALWHLAKGVLFLFLVVAAARAALVEWADHRIEEKLRSLEAAGFSTCPEISAEPTIPREENAALLYLAAFAAYGELDPGRMLMAPEFSIAEEEEREEIRRAIGQTTEIFGFLRRARGMSRCAFQRDYRIGAFRRIPEYPHIFGLSHLLALRAEVFSESGDQQEARETVLDLLSLADRYRLEPSVDLQFARRFLVQSAVETIIRCSCFAWNERSLEEWMHLLPDPSTLDDALERGLRANLAEAATILTQSRKLEILTGRNSWDDRVVDRVFDPLIILCAVDGLDRFRRAIEICRLPFPQARDEAAGLDQVDAKVRLNFNLLRFWEKPISRLVEHQAISRSTLALARAGLEAELAFMRCGHYPTETRFGDEFTGKPFEMDMGEGVIRGSGPRYMDPDRLEREGLIWRLQPR